jgi:predicted phage tail protein
VIGTSRPSEALSGIVGSIVGAVLVLLSEFTDVEVSTNAAAALVVLVSWIAAGVTWYVAKRQRSGDLQAASDGTVGT